jgi:integrase/recombinase XerD
MLEQAINDYLLWMIEKGYKQNTWDCYQQGLKRFSLFVQNKNVPWGAVFTYDTFLTFQKEAGRNDLQAVRGLSKYLFQQKLISRPIERKIPKLPQIYEQYLVYYEQIRQVSRSVLLSSRRVLSALCEYLKRRKISLSDLKIEIVDTFWAEYTYAFAPGTRVTYRCVLRGFLRFLYQRKCIKKDLAPLIIGPPVYAQAKPPKFLRPHEVQKLFSALATCSAKGLRTCAIVYLAYTLGLRPAEISSIHLEDILFSRGELTLTSRKATNPIKLPLPENTIKAIAAYILGARPKTTDRALFVSHAPPYGTLSAFTVCKIITAALRDAHLPGSAYWLRHTYAQGLLECGASIFEIKQMLGHDRLQSSKRYIHIHTKLMREVIFDETL